MEIRRLFESLPRKNQVCRNGIKLPIASPKKSNAFIFDLGLLNYHEKQ
ncbi:hypothetical protein CYPRO_3056 [Cyclonatronum proteinivorum]|uniref:Uncharacterized protein n=1 Tax=Cyclonatronum proteinivorum TaxID=1457365 RepID=A0A345UP90_9BACT|nr:hypothetical protein CYPRO_3056 [Cyclonatronum proteinivorum]